MRSQQLFREVREQGYAGSYKTVSRWLQAQGLLLRRYTLREIPRELPLLPQQVLPYSMVDNSAL
jgi:hypothetical protein